VAFGEQFYCIDINQQLYGAPQSCYQLKQNIHCQVVDSLMQLIFGILIPAVMMFIFGCLTFRNVRQQRRRINAIQAPDRPVRIVAPIMAKYSITLQQPINLNIGTNNRSPVMKTNRSAQKRDLQLITMLLVQVINRENQLE
jgi:hypothetical protein